MPLIIGGIALFEKRWKKISPKRLKYKPFGGGPKLTFALLWLTLKKFFHWLPLLSLPKAAWTDLFNSSFSTCLAQLSRVKTFPWFDKATYRIQYYRVSPVSQSFLQEVGGAKTGTKLIYNGKIEKLKKIWSGGWYIYGPESLFIDMQLMSFTCSFNISTMQFFQITQPSELR